MNGDFFERMRGAHHVRLWHLTREAARRTQHDLDSALGDQAEADRLAEPLVVRELTDDQVLELCPEFADTVPSEWAVD